MKIQNLDQNLKCPNCRTLYPIKTCRRIINFTFGEVTFFCRNCRTKIDFLDFAKWNALHYADQKKIEERKGETQRGYRR